MDSVIIFPPGPSVAGSQLQIGTYLMYDPGPDFGAAGLVRTLKTNNALRDGGAFAGRVVPPRTMSFPLLLRDVGGVTLEQTESLLREWAAPGGMVAIQPENVPSGEAVFFDVIDGRWEPDYNPFENRISRRRGTLFLDTQPWGYWPTEMLLASAASVAWNGALAVNGASVIGDVPPFAHIYFQPTVASVYSVGSWMTDSITWSLAGQPSFVGFLGASQWQLGSASSTPYVPSGGPWAGSIGAGALAPGGVRWIAVPSFSQYAPYDLPWMPVFTSSAAIPSALEPAYRGRFRAYAFLKVTVGSAAALAYPSMGVFPYQAILDCVPAVQPFAPLASANTIATAPAGIPTGWAAATLLGVGHGTYLDPSPNFTMLDMGEISLPPGGSGYQQGLMLRLWMLQATTLASTTAPAIGSTGMPSVQVSFGGVHLIPVDGAAGVLVGGMAQPSIGGWAYTAFSGPSPIASAYQAAFEMGNRLVDNYLAVSPTGASQAMLGDLRALHRGVQPRIGATTNQLTFVTGDRRWGANYPVAHGNLEYVQVGVSYRPTFQFLHGL